MKKVKSIGLLAFKLFSSFCVAYVLALMSKELLSFGLFSFVFLILSFGLSFFYLIKPYSFSSIFMLNLVLVAGAVLLRFYVVTAYSS